MFVSDVCQAGERSEAFTTEGTEEHGENYERELWSI
jgi:hypothetical protein